VRTRAVVQVLAIAVGAVLTFIVGFKYSDAASAWQKGIQAEVTRAGIDQDDVRRVYANEGPNAYRVAAMQIRADALATLARTDPTAGTQREIATQSAFALRSAAEPGTLLGERRYYLKEGGSDLAHRLADVRSAHEQPPPDPDEDDHKGDDLAHDAFVSAVATAVITGVFAVLACVRRRAPAVEESLELIPQPALAAPPQKGWAYALLIIWVASVLIPLVQLVFSSEEQRYQAVAARHIVQARSDESISRTRTEFAETARQIAQEGSVAATAREIAATYESADVSAAASQLARAEEAAADQSTLVAEEMAAVPLDAPLAQALVTQQPDWDSLTALSAEEMRKADGASHISNIFLALIAFVALSGAGLQAYSKRREAKDREKATVEAALADVPAVVASAPPAGPRFLAGLFTGSALGMLAVWWFSRQRRRPRRLGTASPGPAVMARRTA
jgi:hypothetical protein